MPLPLLALGAISSLPKLASGVNQLIQGGKIHPNFQAYQANPLAGQMLGNAENAYNGRMGGAVNAERSIANSQANSQANTNRNATDSAQALQMSMLGQGQADSAYNDLAGREAANKTQLLGNLNNAMQTNIGEGDKVYNSLMQKYQMDAQAKAALNSDAQKNISGAAGDFAGSMLMGQMNGLGGGGDKYGDSISKAINGTVGRSDKSLGSIQSVMSPNSQVSNGYQGQVSGYRQLENPNTLGYGAVPSRLAASRFNVGSLMPF